MRTWLVVSFVLLLSAGVHSSFAAGSVTYSLTVATDSSSYGGSQTITVSGKVSPNPGPNTAVFVQVFNPAGKGVLAAVAPVNASTGRYSFSAVAGGSPSWVTGTYTVNASWGAYGPAIAAKTSFSYTTPTASTSTPTSSSSSVVSSTGASQTASSTPTSPATSTTSTSPSGGGIPEFPGQLSIAAFLAIAVVLSYLFLRTIRRKSTV